MTDCSREPLVRAHGPPRFSLGQVVATPAALEALTADDIRCALARHLAGDWGEGDPDDQRANDTALTQQDRLFSVYHSQAGTVFWIITEANRSSTTVLLPDDY